jgi:hypothetical protein
MSAWWPLLLLTLPALSPELQPVQLDVVRVDASACPDAAGLRARVRGRLGDQAVVDVAARHVIVTFDGHDGDIVASVRLLDEQGDRGQRELGPGTGDCRALADAVVLAVSLVVDPLVDSPLPESPSVAPDDDGPAPTPSSADVAAPRRRPVSIPVFAAPARTPALPWTNPHVDVGTSIGTGVGVLPGASAVVGIDARVGSPALHISGDVTGHVAAVQALPDGRTLSTQALLVGLDGCAGSGHDGFGVDACAGVGGGVLRAASDDGGVVVAPAVVPRVTGTLSIGVAPRWAVFLAVRAGLPVARLDLRAEDAPVWQTPDLAFALGLGARTTFGP